ncbi:MAG: hypothetical protein LBC18_13810 [Opitutaceae bacterium]|jgi:phage gpG-like protein|nr:hypothetical protein [Opitutaceae bacterium]
MPEQTEIRISTQGLERLMRNIDAMNRSYIRVGILGENAKRSGPGPDNAEIARVHEFGSASRGIPERSFLRAPLTLNTQRGLDAHRPALTKAITALGPKPMLKTIASVCEGVSKEAFATSFGGRWPANAPATIAAKGSDRPLIDTGQLRRAVSADFVNQ